MYKLVSTQGIQTRNNATASALVKNVQAINNIGKTLNSVSLVLKDIKKIELDRLDAEKKRRIKESFVPRYTKQEGIGASKFISDFVAKPPKSFWESLLQTFSGLIKLFVIRPILKWLSNKENLKKVEDGLKVLYKAIKFLFNLSKSIVGTTINGLYDLLRADAKWYERLSGFGKVFGMLGGLFLGLRWLKNPGKLIRDVRFVLGGFRKGLLRSQNQLRMQRGMKPLPGSGKVKIPKTKFRGRGWAGLVFISGIGLVNVLSGESVEETTPEMAKGGWISGPQGGYPVSTRGGKGAAPDFIGHGTEYVAKKDTGESFVIPFDTPATRVAPSLTMANMQTAAMLGFDVPDSPPRISNNGMFLGGVFKGIGNVFSGKTWGGMNRGTGKDGTFGSGTWGSGRPSDGDIGKSTGGGKNWLSGLGKGLIAAAPDIGQLIGGDKGGTIGSMIGGFANQMQSGEKMSFGNVLGNILPIAGQFLGPKASGIMGNVLGIGNMFFGPNAGNYSFGDKIMGVLDGFGMSDSPIGRIIGNVSGAMTGLQSSIAGASGFGGGSGGGGAAAAAGLSATPNVDTDDEKNYGKGNPAVSGGGIGAAIRGGQWALGKGFTVSEHRNFRNNKWNKFSANTGKGYVAGGGQKMGKHAKDSLHTRGLALDVTDYRDGDFRSRIGSLAGEAYGMRKALNLTQIIHDGWGAWFGGKKRGPGSYGHPSHMHMGFADEKIPGGEAGGIGLSGTDMNLLGQYVSAESKGATPLESALIARSAVNAGGAYASGQSPSLFGAPGASSFFDILDSQATNKNWYGAPLGGADTAKAFGAINLGLNTDKMYDFLGNAGMPDSFSNLFLNSTEAKRGTGLNKGTPFGKFTFSTGGSTYYDKAVKNLGADFNPFAKNDKGVGSDAFGFGGLDMPSLAGKAEGTATSYGGTQGGTQKPGGNLAAMYTANQKGENHGGPEGTKDKGRNAYAFQKVTREREYARSQLQQKHSQMLQQTIAQVQAHNASVRASVAQAQSAISQIMGSQAAAMGTISGLGGKVQRTAATLTSINSTAAFLA